MKILKKLFLNPIMIFIYVSLSFIFILKSCHKPVKRYVGTVTSVSAWDGYAKLKTKNKAGQDTIIIIHPNRHEQFTLSQIITVWTGGDLIGDFGTTSPMK